LKFGNPGNYKKKRKTQQNNKRKTETKNFIFLGPVVDLLERTAYTTSFDRSRRIPYWSGEHLTKDSLVAGPNVTRDKSTFKSDPSVPAMFRINTKDYTNSGFDRGHQAPAADAERTQDALDETFLLTNIAPQVGEGFNRNCKKTTVLLLSSKKLTFFI
jgi:DNA/RNA endonuclease G (NUC1)